MTSTSPLLRMLLFFLVITGLTALFSCDPCAREDSPGFRFFFEIVDGNGNQLVGENYIYDQNSIELLVDGKNVISDVLFKEPERIYRFEVDYSGFDIFNEETYFLKLGETEIDSVQLTVARTDGDCFDTFTLLQLIYRGEPMDTSTDPILLTRN
jgi:hypothetical protein